MVTARSAAAVVVVLGWVLVGAACKRDVRAPVSVPVGGSASSPTSLPPSALSANGNPGAAVRVPTEAEALAWDLPMGWAEARLGGMRFATFKPFVPGRADASIVVLSGEAGGELANVNRWRDQIGLPPVDEMTRAELRRPIDSKAGTLSLYDFATSGPEAERLVAGLLFDGARTWLVRMMGDEDAVATARPAFVRLLRSLRFEQSEGTEADERTERAGRKRRTGGRANRAEQPRRAL